MTPEQQRNEAARAYSKNYAGSHKQYTAGNSFIAGAEWEATRDKWIKVEDDLPKLIKGKATAIFAYTGKRHVIAYYFPEHFKTIEWEDWDDYSQEEFPYTEDDQEKGCVWLRPGFYQEVECNNCAGYWSSPLPITHWQPLIPRPQTSPDGK